MPMNAKYRGPTDLPEVIPVFPLPGALLLPRGQMPLNIFEPRYLAMVDDALRDGHRLIGMIQPDSAHRATPTSRNCSRSAAPAASPSSPRPGTAVICSSSPASRVSASRRNSPSRPTIASAASLIAPFADDFVARKGEEQVDRKALLQRCGDFLKANNFEADWEGIEKAPNEALVNALVDDVALRRGGKAGAAGSARPENARRNPGRHHRDRARQEERPSGETAAAISMHRCAYDTPSRAWLSRTTTTSSDRPAGSIDPSFWKSWCARSPRARSNTTPKAGTDLAHRQARLSDPRRHSDHAARGSAAGWNEPDEAFPFVMPGACPGHPRLTARNACQARGWLGQARP